MALRVLLINTLFALFLVYQPVCKAEDTCDGLIKQVRASGCLVTNVAQNKAATQSSMQDKGVASRAVDGDLNTNYGINWDGSCTHTIIGKKGWWQVDLGADYSIYSVKITNRGDCCSDRLSNIKIFVYSDNPTTNQNAKSTLCHDYKGPMAAGATEELKCTQTISGRYVRITRDDVLTLCEVQVMASQF